MSDSLSIAPRCTAVLAMLLVAQACSPAAAEGQLKSALPPAPFTFTGQWTCKGTFRAGKPHEAMFSGKLVVAGKWIELTEVDQVPKTGYTAKYLIGVDSEHNQLVEFDANNFAAATYSSADGWVDSALTMTSPVSSNPQAPYVLNRFIYRVEDRDAFTVDWQISKSAEPQWVTADHLGCSHRR